jgi:uncharacterized protein (TIGR00297 family)
MVIFFALIAIASRAIDKGGFLASVVVGYSILWGGGYKWFIIVAAFFTLGVGFTYYKYEYKKRMGTAQEKGGSRNWPNIIANGGVASIFAVAQTFFGGFMYQILFIGAISAAGADTVATELGLLSKSHPRLITRLNKEVAHGTSGGITLLGLLGAFLTSAIIGSLALLVGLGDGVNLILISIFGGVVGSIGDSILGAVLQRKGECRICGKFTEGSRHCDEPVKIVSGLRFIDNNVVNLLATIIGAAAALSLTFII